MSWTIDNETCQTLEDYKYVFSQSYFTKRIFILFTIDILFQIDYFIYLRFSSLQEMCSML